jgi:HEAT repeat protein
VRWSGLVAGVGVALAASAAGAQSPPAPAKAVAPAGTGQGMLGVGYDAQGDLRAALCASTQCTVEAGVALGVPADLRPKSVADRQRTRMSIVNVGSGHRVIWVKVPGTHPERSFEAVVAAPLGGNAPLVLFAGLTGLAEGEDGVRRGGMVIVDEPNATGARNVVIGKQREEVRLCGRSTMLEPRGLSGVDLTFKVARVQRLQGEITEKTPSITAVRQTGEAGGAATFLRAVAASSAVGDPGALTDGKLDTGWAENVRGSGRGEFVLLNAPADLPLAGIEFVVRPKLPEGAPAAATPGASPKELFVATTKQLFRVILPEDGWATPGARYFAPFPTQVQDDCVALVLESAFDEKPDARVTLAEVNARAAIDTSSISGLIAKLRGGGQEAERAKAVLRAAGKAGWDAVAAAFDSLDEGGRRVALQVLDGAPCEVSVGPYVNALVGPYEAHRIHALDHLRNCSEAAAPLLSARLAAAKGRAFGELAEQAAGVAPAHAIGIFLPLMTERAIARRAAIRTALGRVAGLKVAQPSFRKAFTDPATPDIALLDLLRSVGNAAPALAPESIQALDRLQAAPPSFRHRYLGVGPLAELAGMLPRARESLDRLIVADPDPRVRAAAAHAVRDPKGFQSSLVRILGDDSFRVRLAATQALAGAPNGAATTALLARLDADPWPAVRAQAATALAGAVPSTATDERLAKALGDDAWLVRRYVLESLGTRGARAHSEAVLERLEDDEEWPAVRRAAARALGELCYQQALGTLTQHAKKLGDPFASPEERSVAFAALGSLRDLAPKDLSSRLSSLLGKDAPRGARAAARAAVEEPSSRCQPRR